MKTKSSIRRARFPTPTTPPTLISLRIVSGQASPAKQAPKSNFALNQRLETVRPLLLRDVFIWTALTSESTQEIFMRFRSFSHTSALAHCRMAHFRWGISLPALYWTASLIYINFLALLGFLNFNACFK